MFCFFSTDILDEDDDIGLNSLRIVDPASDVIHIDHCYTNRLSNRQILQLSVGEVHAHLQAKLEEHDALENSPAFRQEGTTASRGRPKVLKHLMIQKLFLPFI